MKQFLPSIQRQTNNGLIRKSTLVLSLLLWFGGFHLFGQTPVITARFANPQYDCNSGEYCVDVEFQSDTPGEEIFGLNLRFFYDESVLTLIDTRDFQGGYTGSNGSNPYSPPSVQLAAGAGPVLFNFSGNATFVNGAVSKTNSGAAPILVSTTGWTKLFQACFSVDNPTDLNNFCPSLAWDLEFNPSNGGFPAGDDGLVITLVDPDPNFDSKPSTENVVQYNWQYFDPSATTVPPFGELVEDICISPNCGGSPLVDLSIDISVDNATPLVGDPVAFTVVLNNANGFDQANNITVSAPLPAGFSWSSDDSGGTYNSATGDWTIASLAGGATATLNITATVNASGPYLTLAEVSAVDEADTDSTPGDGVDTDGDMNVEDDPDDDDDGDGVLVSPVQQSPGISLEKAGTWNDDGDGIAEVGEAITYSFTVRNTGNVALTNITVSDPNPGVTVSGGPLASLAPGASDNSTFTASYTLTQTDIAVGSFSNQATATGDGPGGNPVNDNASDDPSTPTPDDPTVITLPAAPAPVPVVTVRLSNPTYDCANETYCLDVEYISDTPGQQLFGTNVRFFYDDSELEFTAFTDFQGGYGEVAPTPPGVTTFPAAQGPAGFGFTGAPEWVNGAIQLTDPNGAITLSTTLWTKVFQICFDVTDPNANLNNFCPPVVWDLEENVLDGGFITGDDGVVITLVNPDPLEDSSPTVENVDHNNWEYDGAAGLPYGAPVEDACIIIRCIDLSLDKSVDNAAPIIGSNVIFTLTLENAGPDDAVDVMVKDMLPGGFTYVSDNSGGKYNDATGDWDVGILAAGASASIEITATVDAMGDYLNLAEVTAATGIDPDSDPNNGVDTDGDMNVEDDPDDEDDGDGVLVTPIEGGLVVTKVDMIDPGANLILNVGDVISYMITVENNSFEFINNITIDDPVADLGSVSCALGEPFSLAPGESTTCTATHTITQADLAAEQVVNIATANGEKPNGDPVSDPSDDPDDPTDNDPDMDGEPDDPTVSNLEQGPVVTVRLANPTYDCGTETYCLDVEYISDTPGQELFGSNVRFFYDDSELQFVGFSDFQGGYGPAMPDPAEITTFNPGLGPNGFTFTGAPEWVNGAIQLNDPNGAITLSTTEWTKIFQICFEVTGPNANLNNFCPPVVWDLEENVYDGGFIVGDDGVVITVVNPDPLEDSSPTIEQVQHHNWQYDGLPGLPYGNTIESACPVIRCIDLSLNKLVDNTTPMIGSQVVFTIRVDNAGPDEAQDVVVFDQLPSGFTYYSDNAAGDYDPNTGEWTIGSIPAGGTEIMQITATVNQAGDYINLAEVSNATGIDPDSDPNNGVDTDGDMMVIDDPGDEDDGDGAGVTPLESADLSLIKGVSASPAATAGSTATFTIVVSNDGPGDASGVEVVDVVPNGYSNIANISGGGLLSGNTITWSNLSIPVGGSLTFTFDATIEASGDYMNLAEITASDLPDVDSTPGNGVDTDGDGNQDDDPDDEDDGDGASIGLIFLICPNNILVNNDPDKCGANVSWAPPSSSDNVGTTVVQTGGPAPGSFFPVGGPTTITYTAYDAAGNPVATCSFTVTVADMQLPTIECPVSFITVGTNGGDCFYTAQGLDPSAKDNCSLSSVTHDYATAPGNTTLDGAEFPVGTHIVTWTATDGNNNSASCTMQITVVDDDAPTIAGCASDINLNNTPGQCGAVVNYAPPTFNDNCGGMNQPGILVEGLPGGSVFPVGSTTVTYEYTDAAGNTVQCSFEVTIEDTQIPEITCPNNIVVGADGTISSGAATVVSSGLCGVTLSYAAPVGTDNCPGAETELTGGQGGAPNFYQYGGYYTETYTVEDAAGNQASCSFTITVEDPVPPQITCPQDITVSTDAGTCDAIVTYTNPLGGDNCPGYSISLTQGLASGSAFPLGTTTVGYTITDNAGNAVSCSFDVTVVDGGAPAIDVCPADQTVATSSDGTGDCQAEIPDLAGQLQASDNCTPAGSLLVTQSPLPGATFGGAHGDEQIVTLTVTDVNGNSASCEVVVTLVDDEAPSIDCSQILTDRSATSGQCSFTMPGAGFDPIFSDNCTATIYHNYAPAPSAHTLAGATFPLGTTSVTWTVEDQNGQTATCTIDITITDDEDPVAMCVPGLTVVLDGSGSFQIPVSLADLGSWDNCGPLASKLISLDGIDFGSIATVDCDDTGAPITVTLQVEDQSGNTSTCTVSVTVLDNEAPDITCPDDIFTATDAGLCSATVNSIAPSGQDNCSFIFDYSLSGATAGSGSDDASGTAFNTGTTVVTYTITDNSNNSASCSFLVVVDDSEAPVAAQCPASPLTATSDANTCGAVVTYLDPLFDDNCDGANLNGTLVDGLPSGSTFPVGTTTVTYEYTDAAGNTAQCSFDVVVEDITEPFFLSCPTDIVVQIQNGVPVVTGGSANISGFGPCGVTLAYPAPLGADNCPGWEVELVFGSGAGPQFYSYNGTYTELYQIEDASGNTAQCSFTITVEDLTAPILTCPDDYTVTTDPGACEAVVDYSLPFAADNCPGYTLAQLSGPASGASFPLGSTTVSFQVTDNMGNSTTCSFDITVVDGESPEILVCALDQDVLTSSDGSGDCQAEVPDLTGQVGATDNCTPAGSLTVTQSPAPGASISGAHGDEQIVTITVTDAAGNSSSCEVVLTLVDDESPMLDCAAIPTDLGTDASNCAHFVSGTGLDPSWTDNCGATLSHDFAPAPSASTLDGAHLSVGQTTVLWTITDENGNTDQCFVTYTVTDDDAPEAICQPNLVITLAGNGEYVLPVTAVNNGSTDNCGTPIAIGGATINGGSSITFTCTDVGGPIPVTLTVTDAAGNSSTCTTLVTVLDVQVPQLTCPTDIEVSTDASQCSAIVNGIAPQFTNDNCPADVTYTLSGATVGSGTADASGTTFNAGATTVTYTYTDGSGNSAICSFEVIVEDGEAPALDCSAINPVRPAATDECSFTMGGTGFDPSWSDNCPGGTLYNDYNYSSSLAGETFPVGVTQVTWTAVDASGNESSCTIDIVIEDTQAPVVDCSGIPSTAVADAGQCSYTILGSGYGPVFSDNCDAVITHDYAFAPNPWTLSGATLPLGPTTITWTVTDQAGNSESCTVTITVTDGSAPSFVNCPADIVVSTDVGQCEANVNFATPVAEDACGVTVTQTGGLPSGSMFPVGTTTVEFTAADAAGNSVTCTFDVTVEETEPPTAVCQDITVSLGASGSVSVVPADVNGGSYDNCQVASLAFEVGPMVVGQMNFGCDALGDNNIVLRVVDAAGNRDNCVATVTVIDDTSPSFTCPDPVTVPGCNALIPDLTTLVSATDNCPNGLTVTQSVPAGLNFGSMNGQSVNITVTVTDASGNAASCVVPVTVDDDVPPAFTNCPADITVNNDPDKCGANVWWAAPTAMDNCTGLTVGQASGPAPGSFIAVGSPQTVTYEATDDDGNSVTCSFTVTVEDMQLPALNCPVSFITLGASGGDCDNSIPDDMLDALAGDNCGVVSLTHDFTDAPDNTTLAGADFPLGVTVVTWTAVDASGNSVSCSLEVTVADDIVPVTVSCPDDISVSNDPGECSAVVTYNAPAFSTGCNGTPVSGVLVEGLPSGSAFPVGTTIVRYEYTDGNGTAVCSFTVTVEDTEDPVIGCPADIVVGADGSITSGNATIISTGPCGVTLRYVAPVGTDNCPNPVTTLSGGLGANPNYYQNGGTYTETYTVTDASGNTATCSFTITVEDPVVPTITCPQEDITVNTRPGLCSAVVTYASPLGSDNCPGYSINLTQGLNSGAAFPLGTTTVEFTITDNAGNANTCSFDVNVIDNEDPVIISCAPDQDVPTSSDGMGDCSGAIPDLTGQVDATDNCTIASITQSPAAGASFGSADGDQQVVTITVTDQDGNSVTCTATVTLVDDEDPIITNCADDQDVLVSSDGTGDCEALIPGLTDEVATNDNCSEFANLTITQSPAAGTIFAGAHGDQQVVTITVTDEVGNSTACEVTLTLVDDEGPTILDCAADQDVLSSTGSAGDCEGLVPDLTGEVTADDNCSASGSLTVTQSPAPGASFSGQQVVVITVTDEAGNASTCSSTVTLVDDEVPTILVCASDQDVLSSTGSTGDCEGVVPDVTANVIATDNCTATGNLTITQSPAPGTAFGGAHGDQQIVTVTVTDEVGNASTCSATVTLVDDEGPVIVECVPDQIVSATANSSGDCEGLVPDLTAQVVATDNCAEASALTVTQSPAPGTPFGSVDGDQQVVTFTVTDEAGNSVSCQATITLYGDEEPSILECVADQNIYTGPDECEGVVPELTGQIVAIDNCTPVNELTIVQNPAAGTVISGSAGTQQVVTFTVIDGAGNSVSCQATLTLVDEYEPMVVECAPDQDVFTSADGSGDCAAVIPDLTAQVSATDNCTAPANLTVTQSPAAGTAFGGAHGDQQVVMFTIADESGNSTTCSTVLTLVDDEAPVLNCPADIYTELSDCEPVAPPTWSVTATDNCSAGITPVQATGPAPGAALGRGVYTVSYTATDEAGNVGNCSFDIHVERGPSANTNLACDYNVLVRLDEDCQRTITASLVLEGDFGCLVNEDFEVVIVNDGGPSNGDILDGVGEFIYEVSLAPGVEPVDGFEPCWGYITAEDKTAPSLDCPDDTDEGTVVFDCYTTSGALGAGSLEMEPLNYSCFSEGGSPGSNIDPGVHYYALIPFQVSATDYYTILVSDEFGSSSREESAIALFQGGFNPSNPCENILAFIDDPLDNLNPLLDNDEPYLRLSLPLIAGETYYLWITSDEEGATGDYTVDICPDNGDSQVGLFSSSTVLNPLTWEPEVVNNGQLWPTREVSLELELYCEDFGLIFNNPASLSITGMPDVEDNCDGGVEVSFVDTYATEGDCASIIITRTFTAVDDSGNTSTCTQTIRLDRPDAGDVEFPPRTVPIECDEQYATLPNGNPAPSVTGYPFIVTVSGIMNLTQDYCNLGASFVDRARVNVCEGSFKFVRDWTVIDWCSGDDIAEEEQVIKVGDFTAPVVSCPSEDYDGDGVDDDMVFSTSPFSCTASFQAPLPDVSDNCSDWEVHTEIIAEVEVDVYNQYGQVTGTALDTMVLRNINWNAASRIVSGIEAGHYFFRYTVEDACGNSVVAYCPFEVRDRVEPTAICDDNLHISIGGEGVARLFAEDVDEGSNDNCGIARIEVRRNLFDPVNYTCGDTYSEWGEYIDFFCCDVGRAVTIELRVTDLAGNENTCWLEVAPEEKARPYCYAPQNVNADCEALPYGFDATDTLQLQQLFGAATAEDNCSSVMVRELPPVVDMECGAGTIIRRFQAVDAFGNLNINTCQQVVTISGVHNYEIRFPADAEAVCGIAEPDSVIYDEIGCDLLAVSHTDEVFSASGDECYKIFRQWRVLNWCQYDGQSDPFIIGRDEDCDNQPGDEGVWVLHRPGGKTYIDRDNDETEPNNIPLASQNVCNGIDDFWRKVDYDGGFYQYTQVIKVYDDIDPQVVYTQPDPFCSLDNAECTGMVELPFQIDENCTPDDLVVKVFLDADADGIIDADLLNLADGLFDDFALTGVYPDYQLNGRFPIGSHAFEVRVEDGCGNSASRQLLFEVVDCKPPAITCINGLAVELMPVDVDGDNIPDEGRMAVWASDFIISPMEDCSGPVKYSINRFGEAPHVDSTSLTLTCADTGSLFIQVWAYDGAGNADLCETYVLVQDNMDICGGSPLLAASGIITTEEDNTVEDVEVSLSGQDNSMMMTEADGWYGFSSMLEGYDYTITPMRDGDYLNGVSTFDLVLISKHILGVQPLDSPYKVIAADVNRSNTVTTLDMILLRKLILSIDTEFGNNTSWRFVEKAYVFPNPANPWQEEFPEAININNLPAGGLSNQDFVAVKVGDVTMDAIPNSLAGVQGRTTVGNFILETEDIALKAGNEYTVTFTADIADVAGYQGTLVFDNSALELVDLIPGLAREENFGMRYAKEGMATTSWNQVPTSDFALPNSAMFSLVFRARTDAQLSKLLSVSSGITKAEAYTRDGRYMDVAANFKGAPASVDKFELYQNQPNPFSEETVIGFYLPEAADATLTISDLTGKAVKLVRIEGVRGYNSVSLRRDGLPAGVLNYTVKTDKHTATRKMVLTE